MGFFGDNMQSFNNLLFYYLILCLHTKYFLKIWRIKIFIIKCYKYIYNVVLKNIFQIA